ncbi:DUF4440 domain-containing protein [Vibrio sp. Of7-15]|uniref:DUF4440 domain-containing protein n=1 Tax=Vibrio sp. Of7-15 TaxID=2724879 RepID=UPI001EF20792|nr:DUF4440 domain-containing protein [Vibrio sp. Of7-15]MCG7497489.1 DUF4440 domain-containing protein [Vibrio sp. Of7-15]
MTTLIGSNITFLIGSNMIPPQFLEVGKSGSSNDLISIVEMMKNEEPSNTRVHSQDYECIRLEPPVQMLKSESAIIDEVGQVSCYVKRCTTCVFTGVSWQLRYH